MTLPVQSMSAQTTPTRGLRYERALILALTLVAFAHVAFGLGLKNLWWDESLSLQRAESELLPLLRGVLIIQDGFTRVPTIDQHPFFSFLLQGVMVRVAGESETSLRFVAAAAATLLVPALYTLARLFVRRQVVPPTTPLWAALLAATSPFLLWYGQEARPYTLWALLAIITTWLLLVALEPRPNRRALQLAYVLALAMFLTTHYYAIFLLPVHALILYTAQAARSRRRALLIAVSLLLVGAAIAAFALWMVLRQEGGGNFQTVTLGILVPDLVNAFSFGLSVDIDAMRLLNLLAAFVAVLGAVWMVHTRAALRSSGWVPLAALLVPVIILVIANIFTGVYMNARHMSLIAGPWLLLLATGLAVIGQRMRWAAVLVALILLGGFTYSTINYYTQEEYQKDDFAALGAYMESRMMPGDVVILYPPSAWRIFEYYVPLERAHTAAAAGLQMSVYGAPLLDETHDTFAWLEGLAADYQRIWVLKSGTLPYYDLEGEVETWLREHYVQVRDVNFFSLSSLRAQLYLPGPPVLETLTPPMQSPAGVIFDDAITLAGASIDRSAWGSEIDGLPTPVTLYWQVSEKPERRAKYILELVEEVDGEARVLGQTEREPWEGDIPTTFWDPSKTILEIVELRHAPPSAPDAQLSLRIQMYDAESLDKLPITQANRHPVEAEGNAVRFPLAAGE